MKRMTAILLTAIALMMYAAMAQAAVLGGEADVFGLADEGTRIGLTDHLSAGASYVEIGRFVTQAGSAFDTYYVTSAPVEWIWIQYTGSDGSVRRGYIVGNPEVIVSVNADGYEEYNGYDEGFVLCESLTMREEPMNSSKSVRRLRYGESCTVLEESGVWYRVACQQSDGTEIQGWVRGEYVLRNPRYYTASGSTAVYAMPVNGAKRVGLISGGKEYPIIGEYGGYWVISLRGACGFVKK